MTKQEQIEELSKELIAELGRETVDKFIEDDQGNLKKIVTYSLAGIAENLYNAGYRKIGDDEIVVNKYEYADLKTFSDCAICEHKEIANARKEMAKEIISYLGTLKEDGGTPFKAYVWYETLCKKYGVEVKE